MKTKYIFGTFSLLAISAIMIFSLTKCSKSSSDDNTPPPVQITVTDIDGNLYHGVTIGTQVWMLENLKVTKYRNGDAIQNASDTADWKYLTTGAYCWYNNDITKKETYGALYNWFTMNDERGLAPTGWHIPTDAEWTTLITYLGGSTVAGAKMKESGTSHWSAYNTNGTNSSGFTALPGGLRSDLGAFDGFTNYADFWSATEDAPTPIYGWTREINSMDPNAFRYIATKNCGLSVRCVKD
jgi:uncharacterized protein (TIGR02145 family)